MLTRPILMAAGAAAATATVTLNGATLQGGTCDTESRASFYHKVPFAQPPVGPLRFMPPETFNGTYGGEYTSVTPDCPQLLYYLGSDVEWDEDCLYMNIWAPPNAKDLPVKVWIFGGSNLGGGVSMGAYDGCNLATDSVVVSINYRTGPWGFLSIPGYGIQGNMGIQDQIMALQWIQKNVKSFGGDPSKVLTFGQSAGGLDSFILGTLPQTKGLIKAGVGESGGGQPISNASEANNFGLGYANSNGCYDLACLQGLPIDKLNNTGSYKADLGSLSSGNTGTVFFGPIVDGKIITEQPMDVGVHIPFILGTTTQEGSQFAGKVFDYVSPELVTQSVYKELIMSSYGQKVLDAYPYSRFMDTGMPGYWGLVQTITDSRFLCPAFQSLNKAVRNGVPVWTYLWGQMPSCAFFPLVPAPLPKNDLYNATHCAEIPFVFGNTDRSPAPNGNCSFTDDEKALSKQFMGFWTSMAANGNPGPDWPQYHPNSSLGLNVLPGSSAGAPGEINYHICDMWDSMGSSGLI